VALIPDEAILRSGEISPIAFRLYCLYCLHRNKETGGWTCSLSQSAKELGASKSRVSEGRGELAAKEWIEIEGSFITPIVGFKGSENRTPGFGKSNSRVRNLEPQGSENRTKGSESRTLPPDPPNRDNQLITSPGDQRESVGNVPPPLPTPAISKNQVPVSLAERDASLSHPAVEIYRQVFQLTPKPEDRQEIIRRVSDLPQYRATLVEWRGKPWNPGNVTGQIERYERAVQARNPEPLPEALPTQAALVPVSQQTPTSSTLVQFTRPGTAAEFQRLPYAAQNAIVQDALETKRKQELNETCDLMLSVLNARKERERKFHYGS